MTFSPVNLHVTYASAAFAPTLPLSGNRVLRRAAERNGFIVSQLTGECRKRPLVRCRWAVMRALTEKGWSSPRIGRLLGGRDHTTILHGLKEADALYARDNEFRRLCDELAEIAE